MLSAGRTEPLKIKHWRKPRTISKDVEAIHRYQADPATQVNLFERFVRNLLHQVVKMNFPEKVYVYVVNESFDVNVKTLGGCMALNLAAEANNLRVVKTLCEVKGIDSDFQNRAGRMALHTASLKNCVAVVKR